MHLPARFWVNQLSLLGAIGFIAYIPAGIVGEFFAIVARHYGPPESEVTLSVVGKIFGFSGLSLLLIGTIAVPAEMSGLNRPYKRDDPNIAEARAMSHKVLLVTISLLAWVAVFSLAVLAFFLREK